MNILKYKNFIPKVGEGVYLAPTATIIGNIFVGKNVSFWFNSVARADIESIEIGDNCNIQDLSMLHVSDGFPLKIGQNVTIGHSVILHGCSVGDSCLIGMGAIILDGAKIGKNSLVAAGSVVTPGKVFPDGALIIGSPAIFSRFLSEEEKNKYGMQYLSYIKLKEEYSSQKT